MKKMRLGMICKKGDILLINFPFTTLLKSKKRPVLVIQDENDYRDFLCFQITSKSTQTKIYNIDQGDMKEGSMKLKSFIKYDKCFTLNSELVDKKLASVNDVLMEKIKNLFCHEI